MQYAISTKNLSRTFKVHVKEEGFKGSLSSIFNRIYKEVEAVKNVNLSIEEGELVGFIGPNGAGKTTTLKMLSGLLHPTGGTAQVLGYTPWERKMPYLEQISLIMGQKAQLWWDLSLQDSLLLQKDIYGVPEKEFLATRDEIVELLDLSPIMGTQVRKLSLGQRMRGELAAALIYKPRILFLDEPTIGLDVIVQKQIREFIVRYNKSRNATILLTSHYLDDVRELCKRLIIIDHGSIQYDGDTEKLIREHVKHKRIILTFTKDVQENDLKKFGKIVMENGVKASIQVPRESTAAIAASLLEQFPVEDISIEDPSLEDVVHELFTKKA